MRHYRERFGNLRPRGRNASARSLALDARGIAAVEFAIVAPLLCLLLAGAVDLGGVLYAQFQLNNAVAAGAAYAEINGSQATSSKGAALAQNVANVVAASEGSLNDNIVVNDGPTSTSTNGSLTAGGTASNADSCYCPSGSAGSPTWGSAASCGTACPGTNTGYAGKFISVSATTSYSPLFSTYGLVNNGTITASAIVQVK